MEAQNENGLTALKEFIFQLDLNEVTNLYRRIAGVSNEKAITVDNNFKKYLYLRIKYPDKNIPPSYELDVFWSLLVSNKIYVQITDTVQQSFEIKLPPYQRYFYQKKYLDPKNMYFFKTSTQSLFFQEFRSKLVSINSRYLVRLFIFIKNHYISVIGLVVSVMLTTMAGSYLAKNKDIRDLHHALDEATRLLTYSDSLIYTSCNASKDIISSGLYYQALYDALKEQRKAHEKFTALAKNAYKEEMITKGLEEKLNPTGKYNDQIFYAGLGVCEMVKLKNIKQISSMREEAVQAIKESENQKKISLMGYFL